MTHKEPIAVLFRKYLAGSISPDELHTLMSYAEKSQDGDNLTEWIMHELNNEKYPANERLVDNIVDHVEVRLTELLSDENIPHRRKTSKRDHTKRLYWHWGAAAAVLVAFTVGLHLWYQGQTPVADEIAIGPGGNRATLTLADGRIIDLDESQSGIFAGEGLRYLDGSAVLEPIASGERILPTVPNVLSTPKGGVYSIILPDGSKVWLNAASTLKYPNLFNGKQRVVELDGEAYFEVVGNEEQPFLVRSGGQVVKVLGTEFNINAYGEERDIVTTLVGGKVTIYSDQKNSNRNVNGESPVVLKPGQQARYSDDGVQVVNVFADDFIAWKNGTFAFYGQRVPEVIRQIERWYDVSFENLDVASDIELWGALSRDVMLSQILETIELNTPLSFKQQERRITIQREND